MTIGRRIDEATGAIAERLPDAAKRAVCRRRGHQWSTERLFITGSLLRYGRRGNCDHRCLRCGGWRWGYYAQLAPHDEPDRWDDA